jgi:hypothetical protein
MFHGDIKGDNIFLGDADLLTTDCDSVFLLDDTHQAGYYLNFVNYQFSKNT